MTHNAKLNQFLITWYLSFCDEDGCPQRRIRIDLRQTRSVFAEPMTLCLSWRSSSISISSLKFATYSVLPLCRSASSRSAVVGCVKLQLISTQKYLLATHTATNLGSSASLIRGLGQFLILFSWKCQASQSTILSSPACSPPRFCVRWLGFCWRLLFCTYYGVRVAVAWRC
jgi:hypothetical protein